jgi:Protein of unknown function (DUF2637)
MRPDRNIGAVTALVVGAVTALAFAQSFHALRGFAEAQQVVPVGWGWMFAATIDGFVLAALLTSLSLSLQGDRGAASWAVRALAVTAAAISLVFNLQHVPAGMARWGAAVPPVAVLAGLEVLLLQVRRAVHRHDPADRLPPAAAAPASHLLARSHPAAIEQPDRAGLPADHTPEAAPSPDRDRTTSSQWSSSGSSVHPAGWRAGSQFRRGGSPAAGPAVLRPADCRWPTRDRRLAGPGHRPQRALRPLAAG